MNESTPRKFKGSLLERAAERRAFGVPGEIAPVEKPQARVKPAEPDSVATANPEETPAPIPTEREAPAQRKPEPVREATSRTAPARSASGRRMVTVDRDLLARKGMLVPGAPVSALAEEMRLVKRQLLITANTVAAAVEG